MEVLKDKKLCLLFVGTDESIVDQFSEHGDKLEFHMAKNSLLAIRWLDKNKDVDAILCEKQIPGQSGFEFHNAIQKKFGRPTSLLGRLQRLQNVCSVTWDAQRSTNRNRKRRAYYRRTNLVEILCSTSNVGLMLVNRAPSP